MLPRAPIVAATRNPDKLVLLRQICGDRCDVRPVPAGIEVAEPEPAHAPGVDLLVGSAAAKAVSVSVALGGVWTIASDGGLLMPGLGARWEPARTRRFAPPTATNRQRAEALLRLAAGLRGDQRQVAWREVIAIAEAGRIVATVAAEATPGWLVEELPEDWDDDGQGFWLPRLWLSSPTGSTAVHGAGIDHWDRLALLVAPLLAGSDDVGEGRVTRP